MALRRCDIHTPRTCQVLEISISYIICETLELLPVAESVRNCKKAHIHAKTLHVRPHPRLYDHPLQRTSLENIMFRKITVIGYFGRIRIFPVALSGQNSQQAHLHKTFHLSLFLCLYHLSQVSTIRYREFWDAARKRIDDWRTDRRTPQIQTFGVVPTCGLSNKIFYFNVISIFAC